MAVLVLTSVVLMKLDLSGVGQFSVGVRVKGGSSWCKGGTGTDKVTSLVESTSATVHLGQSDKE